MPRGKRMKLAGAAAWLVPSYEGWLVANVDCRQSLRRTLRTAPDMQQVPANALRSCKELIAPQTSLISAESACANWHKLRARKITVRSRPATVP